MISTNAETGAISKEQNIRDEEICKRERRGVDFSSPGLIDC